MDARRIWGSLAEEPVFALTGDQDWAPEWAMASALDLTAELGLPMHVFATNASEVLTDSQPGVSIGIHPNFLPGSTHGISNDEVIEHCSSLYPSARTVRTHCHAESTQAMSNLANRGFHTDSNSCLFLQPGITPGMHSSGMIRLPIYLEDDVLLGYSGTMPGISEVLPTLFSPGLKVLNFHPVHVALNTPTVAAYNDLRPHLYGEAEERPAIYAGRGVRDFLIDLVDTIRSRGHDIRPFLDVAASASAKAAAAFPDGICGWRAPEPNNWRQEPN